MSGIVFDGPELLNQVTIVVKVKRMWLVRWRCRLALFFIECAKTMLPGINIEIVDEAA